MHGGTEPAPSPACQSESCHLRPNERSRKSGIDFGTSRPGNPTPRQNRAVSPAANTDHIRRKGKALRSRTVRTRPAQASEPQPQQQGAERLRSAIRRMYKRAGADEGIVPLSYRRRSTPALCHSQNERSRPRKRRNNIPNSSERNARARQFSERATVLAADVFDRPLRFRITRREGKDEHPFLFVLESPIYKSFRRKKPAPALHTAIYHTRRKRRLTAAVRLCKNGRPSSICFALCLSCSPKHAQLEPPAKKRRSVQKPRRHARQNLPPPPSARTAHARRTTRTSYSSYGRPT